MDAPLAKNGPTLGLPATAVFLVLFCGTSLWGQAEPGEAAVPPAPGEPDVPVESGPRRRTDEQIVPRFDLRALRFGAAGRSRPSALLADAPNMFGDSFGLGGDLTIVIDPVGPVVGMTDLPLAAGCRRAKVAENNKPLPQDRIYVLYNHFHHALEFDRLALGTPRDFPVDRYTLGFEKTFFDRQWSVELRMPFASDMEAAVPDLSVDGGNIGNLAVLLKRLVYESDSTAVAIGLGIDAPTGSDVRGSTLVTDYALHNQAVHLLPFVGFVQAPGDDLFWEGFLQMDVPANGNSVELSALGPGTLGVLREQTLLYLDLSGGCWLYRNACAAYVTGLASVVELHYTTALEDADVVAGTVAGRPIQFQNSANRMDVLNLTFGLHGEMANCTSLRVGGVFPLSDSHHRFFDAEIQAQLERRF